MKRRVLRGLGVVLAGLLGAALLVLLSVPYVGPRLSCTRPYVWVRVPRVVVSLDGKPIPYPVYRSSGGQLLLLCDGRYFIKFDPKASSVGWCDAYVIDPKTSYVGDVDWVPLVDWGLLLGDEDGANHFLITPQFALVMNETYRPGASYGWDESDHRVTVRGRSLGFQDGGCPRVRLRFF